MERVLDQLRPMLELVVAKAGIPSEDLTRGIEVLNYGAMRVALEAGHAASQCIALHDAIGWPEAFPTLHKVHLGIQDMLVLELPAELLPIALAARDLMTTMPVEPIRYHLARTACTLPINSADRALARFVLFEAVRFNLLVATLNERVSLAYADVDDETISELAESEVVRLIEAQADVLDDKNPEPVRPLHLLVAAALARLTEIVDASARAATAVELIRESSEIRAEAEAALSETNATDALLLRNWLSPLFGTQPQQFDRLSSDHPLLFDGGPKRNTLDKRLSRNRQALRDGRSLPRTKGKIGPTLIDVLTGTHGAIQ